MIKLSFGILLTIFMVSCGENVTQEGSSTKASSALEDEYNALMEKQKMAKMKSALEAERLREEAARLEKIKAERRSYGLQQMTLLMAQLRADKITAADEFKMYKRIELWMNVKSDDKPFFGNPNSSRALFKEAGMPDAWIDSQLRVGGFKVN